MHAMQFDFMQIIIIIIIIIFCDEHKMKTYTGDKLGEESGSTEEKFGFSGSSGKENKSRGYSNFSTFNN